MSSGRILFSKSCFACFRDTGKNMASDFDLTVLDLKCMMSPKREKCLSS